MSDVSALTPAFSKNLHKIELNTNCITSELLYLLYSNMYNVHTIQGAKKLILARLGVSSM